MKKLFIVLGSEAPKGFKKIGGGGMNTLLGNVPKWDFDANPIFQGWYVHSRTAHGENGDFQVHECLNESTKAGYGLMGGIVLDERFSDTFKDYVTEERKFVRVYIEYVGKPKGKKYKNFSFAVDESAVFNYAEFPGFTGERVTGEEKNPRDKDATNAQSQSAIPEGFNKVGGQNDKQVVNNTGSTFTDDAPF